MSGSCWCGGNADVCSELEEHVGPDVTKGSYSASSTIVARCSGGCGRDTSVNRHSRVCDACRSAANRAYFASPAADAAIDRVMGRAPVTQLRAAETEIQTLKKGAA